MPPSLPSVISDYYGRVALGVLVVYRAMQQDPEGMIEEMRRRFGINPEE